MEDIQTNQDTKKSSNDDTWVKLLSSKHKTHYWYNTKTNESTWIDPHKSCERDIHETSDNNHKLKEFESKNNPETKRQKLASTDTDSIPQIMIRLAVIVPFRDLHKEQDRTIHLNRFTDYMPKFLAKKASCSNYQYDYVIYIIEQNPEDNLKFNRGKLLNIGT